MAATEHSIKFYNHVQNLFNKPVETETIRSDKSIWSAGAGWKNKLSFDILTVRNTPNKGVTTYITSGLSEYELKDDQNNKPSRRIEFISVLKDNTDFQKLTGDPTDEISFYKDNLMYLTCYMINELSYVFPGDVWNGFFTNSYQKFSKVEHLFFMHPKLITNRFQPFMIDDKEIEMLLCVPITQKELDYCQKNDSAALEKLLVDSKVDISNLFRKSLI